MKKVASFFQKTSLILLSFYVFYSLLSNNIFVYAHSGQSNENCGTYTYYFERDSNNGKVEVDFKSNSKIISVKSTNGWIVTKVELDVKDDNHTGFWKYSDGELSDFNPNPGGEIEEARVTVSKTCFTQSPTVKPTVKPTIRPTEPPCPTDSPIATPTPIVTPSATPTDDPCEGNCSPTPSSEPSSTPKVTDTPVPTVYDVCQNIDGIQTYVPENKHLDATNLNCVEFSPSGPSNSNVSDSVVVVSNVVPQVLGASTMAKTGTFEDSFYYSIFSVGSLFTSLGIIKNAKKKEN